MTVTRRWFVRRAAAVAVAGGAAAAAADDASAADSGAGQFEALGVGTTPLAAGLQVAGSLSGALASVQQEGTAGHALSVILAGAGGASQAALNAVSENPRSRPPR